MEVIFSGFFWGFLEVTISIFPILAELGNHITFWKSHFLLIEICFGSQDFYFKFGSHVFHFGVSWKSQFPFRVYLEVTFILGTFLEVTFSLWDLLGSHIFQMGLTWKSHFFFWLSWKSHFLLRTNMEVTFPSRTNLEVTFSI